MSSRRYFFENLAEFLVECLHVSRERFERPLLPAYSFNLVSGGRMVEQSYCCLNRGSHYEVVSPIRRVQALPNFLQSEIAADRLKCIHRSSIAFTHLLKTLHPEHVWYLGKITRGFFGKCRDRFVCYRQRCSRRMNGLSQNDAGCIFGIGISLPLFVRVSLYARRISVVLCTNLTLNREPRDNGSNDRHCRAEGSAKKAEPIRTVAVLRDVHQEGHPNRQREKGNRNACEKSQRRRNSRCQACPRPHAGTLQFRYTLVERVAA